MTTVNNTLSDTSTALDDSYQAGTPKTIEFVSGYGQFYTTQNGRYKAYPSISGQQIKSLLSNPQLVEKSKSQWVIFSDCLTRDVTQQRQRGNFYALWFDIDNSNVSMELIREFLAQLFCVAYVYSTKSSTSEKRKWRGVIPFNQPINGLDFELYQTILNNRLEDFGIIPDRATERANQLCYLPNRGELYEYSILKSEYFLNPSVAFYHEAVALKLEKIAITSAAIERKKVYFERATALIKQGLSPLNAFKEAYELKALLIEYGYAFNNSGKFLSPNSLSGNYQGRLTDNGKRWISHHGSDLEAGVGRSSFDGKSCSGDAFDLFVFYQCNNDFRAAITKAGDMFETLDGKTLTQSNREQHQQGLANNSNLNINGFLAGIQGSAL